MRLLTPEMLKELFDVLKIAGKRYPFSGNGRCKPVPKLRAI
jgi:hypothetical protein